MASTRQTYPVSASALLRRGRRLLVIPILALPLLAGCAQPAGEPVPLNIAADTAKQKNDISQGWGTIKGRIVFGGKDLPVAKELNVDKDQEHCLSQGKIFDQEWVIDEKTRGVKSTFVWLAPDPDSQDKIVIHPDLKKITEQTVEMDQPCCKFEPRCLAMREGQVLIARNSGEVAHNFKYTGSDGINDGANPIISPGGYVEIKGLKADPIPISVGCVIHGWMKAAILVLDHPYFAVTDEHGNFEIKNAPAGNYRLVVFHEAIGFRDTEARKVEGEKKPKKIRGLKITVKDKETLDLKALEIKP